MGTCHFDPRAQRAGEKSAPLADGREPEAFIAVLKTGGADFSATPRNDTSIMFDSYQGTAFA
jgi:hypothetical protein